MSGGAGRRQGVSRLPTTRRAARVSRSFDSICRALSFRLLLCSRLLAFAHSSTRRALYVIAVHSNAGSPVPRSSFSIISRETASRKFASSAQTLRKSFDSIVLGVLCRPLYSHT